jgi:two-component system cell cycle sensor histidine kinase PleC
MPDLLSSAVQDHDWHLVVLAGVIGMVASLAGLSLLARAAAAHDRPRMIWITAIAAVAGGGVSVTQLTAMQGSEPWLTVVSVAVAMLLVGGAFTLGLVGRRQQIAQSAPSSVRADPAIEEARRRLEAENADLTAALEAANAGDRAKSQFLATMSHELRTQLNAIIGFAEFLGTDLCGSLTAKQRGYVGDIHRAGGHLLQLVSDVHDLARIDSRQLVLDDNAVDVGEAIADAINATAAHAAEVGIALGRLIAPGLPSIRADARRLRQILQSLLANAVKFTPKGGTITLSADRRGVDLAIVVSDTGSGMAPEHLAIALGRSGQDDNRFARPYDGGGAGLPLVKRLVELHGAAIAIDSTPGRGTTVTILFPADRVISRSAAA